MPPRGTDRSTRQSPDVARFDADATSVRAARRFVVERAGLSPQRSADVELVASEVATNAVLHARTPFEVRVQHRDGTVRVEVSDANPAVPVVKDHGPGATTGRGLRILDALADCWGVDPAEEGKTVWFEIAVDDRSEVGS